MVRPVEWLHAMTIGNVSRNSIGDSSSVYLKIMNAEKEWAPYKILLFFDCSTNNDLKAANELIKLGKSFFSITYDSEGNPLFKKISDLSQFSPHSEKQNPNDSSSTDKMLQKIYTDILKHRLNMSKTLRAKQMVSSVIPFKR